MRGEGQRGVAILFTVLAVMALLLCMHPLYPPLPSLPPPTCRVPRPSDGHDGAVVAHARHKGVGRHPGGAADHPLDHLGSSSNLRGGGQGWRGRGREGDGGEGKAGIVTQGSPPSTLCDPDHHPPSHSTPPPPIIMYLPPPRPPHLGVVQGQQLQRHGKSLGLDGRQNAQLIHAQGAGGGKGGNQCSIKGRRGSGGDQCEKMGWGWIRAENSVIWACTSSNFASSASQP